MNTQLTPDQQATNDQYLVQRIREYLLQIVSCIDCISNNGSKQREEEIEAVRTNVERAMSAANNMKRS